MLCNLNDYFPLSLQIRNEALEKRIKGLNSNARTLMCKRRLVFVGLEIAAPSSRLSRMVLGAEFPRGWGPANGGRAPARFLRALRRDLSWAWGSDPETPVGLNSFFDSCKEEARKVEDKFPERSWMNAMDRLDRAKANRNRLKSRISRLVDSHWEDGRTFRSNHAGLSLVGRRRLTRQCDRCEWQFATESDLRRHVRNLHLPYGGNEPQPNECPAEDCSFSSKTKGRLRLHLAMAHPGL